MKTKISSVFLAILILQNACTVKIPLSSNTRKVHNEAQYVQPYYSVKKKKMTNAGLLLPLAGIGLGYYLFNTTKDAGGNALAPEIISKNKASATYIAIGGIGLGLISILINKPKITEQRVSSKDFNSWLNKYSNKNNKNYKLLSNDAYSYLIIPNNNLNDYEEEEDRQDKVAYVRVINGEIYAYQNYMEIRPVNSKRYNDVIKMKDECEFYYKAMYSTPTNNYTFDNMLSNCEKYLKLYPQFKGNEIFFKNVVKRYNDILLIPSEIREKKITELKTQADDEERRNLNNQAVQEAAWLLLIKVILSPSNSNSSGNSTVKGECNRCHGSGRISEYQGPSNGTVRVTCNLCGGSGKQ